MGVWGLFTFEGRMNWEQPARARIRRHGVDPVLLIAGAVFLALMLWWAVAQAHEAQGQGNAAQINVPHADATLVAGVTAAVLGANTDRVTAICRLVSATSARLGDATTGATIGTLLDSTFQGVSLDTTDALYAYSVGGGTINCHEVVRP